MYILLKGSLVVGSSDDKHDVHPDLHWMVWDGRVPEHGETWDGSTFLPRPVRTLDDKNRAAVTELEPVIRRLVYEFDARLRKLERDPPRSPEDTDALLKDWIR